LSGTVLLQTVLLAIFLKFLVDGLYKITNIRMRAYSVSWNINGRNRKTGGEHQ
jgi:hypothetical protein